MLYYLYQVHNMVGQAIPPEDFLTWPNIVLHYTTKVCEVENYLYID